MCTFATSVESTIGHLYNTVRIQCTDVTRITDVHMHTNVGLVKKDIRGDTERPLEDIPVVDPGAVVHQEEQLHKATVSL